MSPAGWRTVTLGRTLVCLLLGTALLGAFATGLTLPDLPVLLLLAAGAVGFAVAWRRAMRVLSRAGLERVAVLMLDVVALTAVLMAAGPAARTLSPLLVLPVTVAAMTLPLRRSLFVIAAAVAGFGWLQVDVALHGAATAPALSPWLVGATLTAVLALFGFRITEVLRVQRRRLTIQSQRAERAAARAAAAAPAAPASAATPTPAAAPLTDFATLAAGTAHEMGTPLSTLTMLLGELRRDTAPPSDWRQAVDVLWQATQSCRRSLQDMAEAVERGIDGGEVLAADAFAGQLLARFAELRPDAPVALALPEAPLPSLRIDATVRQALLNLLDNAAKVSGDLTLAVQADAAGVALLVLDRGPGLPAEVRAQLGQRRVKSGAGAGGHGIGVLLAHTAVARAGGSLVYSDRDGGGTEARVWLPRSAAPAVTSAAHDGHGALAAHPSRIDDVALATAANPFNKTGGARRTTGRSAGLGNRSNQRQKRDGTGPGARHTATEDLHVPRTRQ